MTNINIYDADYKRINEICSNLRITPADLIESTIEVIANAATISTSFYFGKYHTEGEKL
jgi:hypothetical protein